MKTIGKKKLFDLIDEYSSSDSHINNYVGYNESLAKKTLYRLKLYLSRRLK